MRQIKNEKICFTTLNKNNVTDIMALKEITKMEPPLQQTLLQAILAMCDLINTKEH